MRPLAPRIAQTSDHRNNDVKKEKDTLLVEYELPKGYDAERDDASDDARVDLPRTWSQATLTDRRRTSITRDKPKPKSKSRRSVRFRRAKSTSRRSDARGPNIPDKQSTGRLLAYAEEKGIENAFWSCYIPMANQSEPFDLPERHAGSHAMYKKLLAITSTNPLVERCVRAFAFACLGRQHRDRRLNMRGAHIYSTVIRQVSAMVVNPAPDQVDELLACCLAMCYYEALKDDTEPGAWYLPGWADHVGGLCQIIRTYSVSDSPSLTYAWRETRLQASRLAMWTRQPVFSLGRPPKTDSQTENLELYDDLLDMYFAVTRWFPYADRLMKGTDEPKSAVLGRKAVHNVVQRGSLIAEDLLRWEGQAVDRYCDSRHPSLYSLRFTADAELFSILTCYWMLCMLLYSNIQLFVARFSLSFPDLDLPDWIDARTYALFLEQTVPIASHPSLGVWSQQQTVLPLIATMYYFAGTGNWETPEARSLRNFIEDESRPGNELARRWFRGIFGGVKREHGDIIPKVEMVSLAQKWYGVRDGSA